MDESDGHILRKWVSVGDIMVLVTALVSTGVMVGQLKTEVRELKDDVGDIRAMQTGPTPGAAQALAAIVEKDRAQDQSLTELRIELRAQRQEMIDRLARIETSLENRRK